MSGVAGRVGCWWWATRNWWRLLGMAAGSSGPAARDASSPQALAAPLPPDVVAMPDALTVPIDELTLLRRIFGPEEPMPGEREPENTSHPPQGPVAGERMFRFGDVALVRGVPVYWAQCQECGEVGREAGTADAALAWSRIHRHQHGTPHPFRLLSAAPVRIVPMAGR